MKRLVMPAFVFERHRATEIETGLGLAGQLVIGDIPRQARLELRYQYRIFAIIGGLERKARRGILPYNELIIGWRRGRRPANTVGYDDAAIDAWLSRSLIITVHVDRFYGSLRYGSVTLEQMGYPLPD